MSLTHCLTPRESSSVQGESSSVTGGAKHTQGIRPLASASAMGSSATSPLN
ncbi:hypothetical protein KIPB_016759, partial [Kipferlia bialata]|eukprot:g16759.t1